MAIEEFNNWVDENINSQQIPTEEWCDANGTLDWIMQKNWTTTLYYQSWPDGNRHTVKEGLMNVFNFIQDVDSNIRKMKLKYNQKLYELYKEVESLKEGKDLIAEEKLKKIEQILKS